MDEHLKLEMPAQVREFAEKTIDQAEKGFSAFIDAANKSVSILPPPATDLPLKALSMSERNMKAAFDHARRLLQAKDVQDAMRIQADFLKAQYESATEQLKELGSGVRSSAENLSKTSVEIK
jgi:phasin